MNKEQKVDSKNYDAKQLGPGYSVSVNCVIFFQYQSFFLDWEYPTMGTKKLKIFIFTIDQPL